MRKVICCLLLLIFVAGMAGACMGRIPAARQRSNQPADLVNPPGFRMESQQATYAADASQVRLTIYNDTDQFTTFGAAYALEVESGGAWYDVPQKGVAPGKEPTWPAISYELPAKGSAPAFLNMNHHGPIEPGRYRVIKELGPLSNGAEPVVVVALFTVRPAEGSEPDRAATSRSGETTGQTTTNRSGETTGRTTQSSAREGPTRTSAANALEQTTVSTTPPVTIPKSEPPNSVASGSGLAAQDALSVAVPALCKTFWNLKTVQTVGFTRTGASRQATWDCWATTLRLVVMPKVHEHFRSTEWQRSAEDGIELYRQETTTHWDGVDGTSGEIYAKTLRMTSETLSGIMSREAIRPNIRIDAITLDQFRRFSAHRDVPFQDAEYRPTGERWTIRLQNERVDLNIALTPPPFNRIAALSWAGDTEVTVGLDGAVEYWVKRQPANRSMPESVALAYPSAIGLLEVRGERRPRYGEDPAEHPGEDGLLDFIDVDFVREIIARLD